MIKLLEKFLNFFNLSLTAFNAYKKVKYLTDFGLQRRNALFEKTGAPDGLPLPSAQMVFLVTGQYNIEGFYQNGILGAESIKNTLKKNGLDINDFKSILDFGCGCGRVLRFWKSLNGPEIYGTDYNEYLVKWCQKSLTFAKFKTNQLSSKLDYEDNKFDFIYAISVFTHLTEKLQKFWVDELTRILKSGGYLLITTHGLNCLSRLSPDQKKEFDSGRFVIVRKKFDGTNVCSTYHPEKYMRQYFTNNLSLIDFIQGGAKDAGGQDVYLFKKN
ncbi:MAG: class I SAM-dependent methyltransferase [Nitrospiria bacterium]